MKENLQKKVNDIQQAYLKMAESRGTHCVCCFVEDNDDFSTHVGFFPHYDDATKYAEWFIKEAASNKNGVQVYLNNRLYFYNNWS